MMALSSFAVFLALMSTAAGLSTPSVKSATSQRHSLVVPRRDTFAPLVLAFPVCLGVSPSPVLAIDLKDYQDGPRGIKYLVTNEGAGAKPVRAQKVKTSYTLYLNGFPEDGGRLIDSSKGLLGDKPFEFVVGVSQVVKGWDLSLLDMKEGESRRLVIPPELGYGEKGVFGIPGGTPLYFDIQLTQLGTIPTLKDDQVKWLEDHPL